MRNYLNCAFEVKELTERGQIEGYGSVFGVVDQGYDVVKRGAFKESLALWKSKGRTPKMLWQHDTREPIGKWDEMKEDSYGLYVKGRLFIDDIPKARQAYILMKEQAMEGLSIGYMTEEATVDPKGQKRTITKAKLFEVSPVTFAMNEDAIVTGVKSWEIAQIDEASSVKDLEDILREAGFSKAAAVAFIAKCRRDANRGEPEDATARLLKSITEATEQYRKAHHV